MRDCHRDRFLTSLEGTSWEQVVAYRFLSPTGMDRADIVAAIEWSATNGRLDLVARMAARIAFDLEAYGSPRRTGPWLTAPMDGARSSIPTSPPCAGSRPPRTTEPVRCSSLPPTPWPWTARSPDRSACGPSGSRPNGAGSSDCRPETPPWPTTRRRRMRGGGRVGGGCRARTVVTAHLEAALQDLMFDDAAIVVHDLDELQPMLTPRPRREPARARSVECPGRRVVRHWRLRPRRRRTAPDPRGRGGGCRLHGRHGRAVSILARVELGRAVSLLAETRRGAQQEPGRADLEARVGAAAGCSPPWATCTERRSSWPGPDHGRSTSVSRPGTPWSSRSTSTTPGSSARC